MAKASEVSVDNPLYAGDVLFYPSGAEAFSRGADRQLTVFYTVYPGAGFAAAEATLELQRNGRTITSAPVTLGPRDAHGRIQQVSRHPAGAADAGHVRAARRTRATARRR